MAEAERLCARIGFLARGKLVAEGTTQELVAQAKAETLDDAFIKLTGEELSDKDGDVAETIAAEG
jgi:ABC-2 type transport system ATP-binding protein